jgi:alanyl-tRNA synthetase
MLKFRSSACSQEPSQRELEREELNFQKTLESGEKILAGMITAARAADPDAPKLSGLEAFTLYDTYGTASRVPTTFARAHAHAHVASSNSDRVWLVPWLS